MSKQVQAQKFQLSGSGVSASATTIALVTLATPDGTAITMTDFGSDVGYATLEPGTAREESISFTGITSTSLTGVSRGLRFVSPFDIVAGNKKAHAGGTVMVFSNTSAFYSRFVDDFNAQTIAGIKTFSSIPVLPASDPTTANQAARKAYVDTKVSLTGNETIAGVKTFTSTDIAKYNAHPTFTLDEQIIDKKYADDLAIAGAPNASTTVKGIVEEATAAEVTAGTQTGGTGARLFVNPGSVAETGADKIVKTKSTGLLDASIIPPIFYFGDGSDGVVTISAPTTLTRDMYYSTLTVNSTLTTDGYKIFVSGTLSGNGTIDWGTANAGSVGSSTTGAAGSGGTATGNGIFLNSAGGAGGAGSTGNNGSNGNQPTTKTSSIGVTNTAGVGGGGGKGGGGGPTSSGGAGGTVSILTKAAVFAQNSLFGIDFKKDGTWIPYQSSNGGGGGGGGGSNSGNIGGGGGGGGASGGIVFIVASVWAGTFIIKATGGAGGNGGTQNGGGGGAGAGGAGGAGGASFVVYKTKTWTGSYNLAGGAAGLGNAGGGASGGGETAAGAGTTGTSYEIAIATLTR